MAEEQEAAAPDPALRERVLAVLAAFHGKTTTITNKPNESPPDSPKLRWSNARVAYPASASAAA